jgi:hypothetical protein
MRRASSDAEISNERTFKRAVDRRLQKAESLEVSLIIRLTDPSGLHFGIRSPNFYLDQILDQIDGTFGSHIIKPIDRQCLSGDYVEPGLFQRSIPLEPSRN